MDGTLLFFIFIVGIIILIIVILGLMNRIIFKMAARNFSRRKAQSVIVIAGLMIGTAIISSALVVQDTMTNGFEVDVYQRLGDVDEEIWGLNSFGTVTYFSESIYNSMTNNLTSVPEIDGVAPVIRELGAALDWNTNLSEPSAVIFGMDSQILRATAFGDLDGHGYYPDSLHDGELAINSRLGDELEASRGDTIQLSYGAQDLSNPLIPNLQKKNFTIAKIIKENDLYGKANYQTEKAIFFELDTLQQLLNRPGEINHIWISNKGDYKEGEQYTKKVNGTIEAELDKAVGMTDLDLRLDIFNDSIVLNNKDFSPFPLHHAQRLFELEQKTNATIIYGLMVPTITLGNIPTNNRSVMGVYSTLPDFPVMDEKDIHFLSGPAIEFNISDGMRVTIITKTLTGMVQPNDLTAYQLGAEHESYMPVQLRAIVLGVMNFTYSQELLHQGAYGEEMVTFVMVSGLDFSSLEQTQVSIEKQMDEDFKGDDLNLEVHNVKADELEFGRESGESIGILFSIFGMFAIIAGIVLIINIFVMLGEERKSEMGMARAVGMKSKHLVRMYVFEGSFYAFVAAIVGALLGLFFGWGIIQAFEYIFGSTETTAEGGFNIPFYFTWESIFIAFSLGLLITFATIFFISTRITKLNIIRAIRRIPEPRTSSTKKKTNIIGVVLVVFGVLFCLWGFNSSEGAGWMIGLPFIFIGSAMVAYKWISFRATITVAGFLIIFFMIPPFDIPVMSEADYSGAEAFILSGVFLVLAGVFIVMFNSDILLKALQKTIGRGKSTRAVLKTAISYPMDNKFKTAMTLGMFALIIFTVTVIAMIASMQASQGDAMLKEQSGGYDVMGFTNPRTPFAENISVNNLNEDLNNIEIEQFETISTALVKIIDYDRREGQISDYGPSGVVTDVQQYNLRGVTDSFLEINGFTLMERDKRFKTDNEAWEALKDSANSYCIVDGSRLENMMMIGPPPIEQGGVYVGGSITITDFMGQNRTRTLEIIGIMDQSIFFQGIIIKKEIVKNEYGGVDDLAVIKLGSSEDADAVAKSFEKSYLEFGLQTFDLKGTINDILSVSNNMMYLMEGYLGIGLLVGIAGIGIISYRNVIERRQQIGMLRAIGFKKRMITKSFLIETSFITILAILIGILLGIGIGWTIYKDGFKELGADFVIPWMNLLAIALIAYIATLIFTFYPSLKAAKIPPAEALRYIE
jgi:putative ABC transport system permease protein